MSVMADEASRFAARIGGATGVEPRTSCKPCKRSFRLSDGPERDQVIPDLVERAGLEPASPACKAGALPIELSSRAWGRFRAHLSAFSARRFHQISFPGELVRTRRIELLSPEWRSGIEPINYIRISVGAARRSPWTISTRAAGEWWEVDGIEPLARRDRVYSAATAPACPYWHFPGTVAGPRFRTWPARLMRPRGPQDCPHQDCPHQVSAQPGCSSELAARRRVDRHARRHSSASNGDWRPLQLTRREWRKAAVSIRSGKPPNRFPSDAGRPTG